MANLTKKLFVTAVLSLANEAYADGITVVVDGRSGPWSIVANPTFSYGGFFNGSQDQHLAPTLVDATSGVPFTVGDFLRIAYVNGIANGGSGNTSTADGSRTWNGNGILDEYLGVPAPGHYIAGINYLEQVVGTFANSNGIIVGSPFTIGNGPVYETIPFGATQLLIGVNDAWYNDNGGSLHMNVTEVATIPEPQTYAMMLAGLGLLSLVASRKN